MKTKGEEVEVEGRDGRTAAGREGMRPRRTQTPKNC